MRTRKLGRFLLTVFVVLLVALTLIYPVAEVLWGPLFPDDEFVTVITPSPKRSPPSCTA
jgi:hypothetical protein